MSNFYYDTLTSLEQNNIARDYILGWASGYLGNPQIEEQRITEGYQAGYEDGRAKTTDNSEKWKTT